VYTADYAASFGLCTCGSWPICTYTHRDAGLYTAYVHVYIRRRVYTPYLYLTPLLRLQITDYILQITDYKLQNSVGIKGPCDWGKTQPSVPI
jgi:hypothetical protein